MPSEARLYKPDIFDFARLFQGIDHPNDGDWGFPEGSSILISGAPGAGKSMFSLAVARGLIFSEIRSQCKEDTSLVYYVSTEVGMDRLRRIFCSTGWFSGAHVRDFLQLGESNDVLFGDKQFNRFRKIVMPIDTARPVPTSDELINSLTFEIRKQHADSPNSKAIVIVDSLTALLRDCRDRGEERRLTHEFIHRLVTALGEQRLGLTFFISEETAGTPAVVPVEEYVVDFVFRLRLRDTGMGRRLRVLDVIKSHGARLRLGEHTWSVLTREGLEDLLAPPPLQLFVQALATDSTGKVKYSDYHPSDEFVQIQIDAFSKLLTEQDLPQLLRTRVQPIASRQASEQILQLRRALHLLNQSLRASTDAKTFRSLEGHYPGLIGRWGTICIYPATGLPAIGTSELRQNTTTEAILATGVPGLDEMLNFDAKGQEFWMQRELGKEMDSIQKGLLPGTITLLAGHAGAGKTNMCLQFLLAHESPEATLYINFELPYHEVINRFPDEARREHLDKIQHIYRRRGNLDINALLAEVRFLVRFRSIRRIAIDGLSSVLATTTPTEYSRLIESLIATIRMLSTREDPITVFLTYEPESSDSPSTLEVPRISAIADNLILLQQVSINDAIRKSIRIAKARGLRHDQAIREVRIQRGASSVSLVAGLEAFTGLLSGPIAKVNLALQLFHENSAEERFNEHIKNHLKKVFNYEVDIIGFSRDAIARTLDDLESPTPRTPASNIKVLSFDEWQIRDYMIGRPRRDRLLLPLKPFEGADGRSAEQNFWASDIRKAKPVGSDSGDKEPPDLLAIPNYLDFGMFCVNLDVLHTIQPRKSDPVDQKQWLEIVDELPRKWAQVDGLWFKQPKEGDDPASLDGCSFLVDWMASVRSKGYYGFVFDLATVETAAVTFLELAWAFGHGQEEVFDGNELSKASADSHPAAYALRFLMFLVANRLMPREASIDDSCKALFSRHFYSTFCDIMCPRFNTDVTSADKPVTPLRLMLVPFMPVGERPGQDSLKALTDDVNARKNRFLAELDEVLKDRGTSREQTASRDDLDDVLVWAVAHEQLRPGHVCSPADFKNTGAAYRNAVDYRDIVRHIKRHQLRLRLLQKRRFSDAISESSAIEGKVSAGGGPLGIATGYCCTGSWMLGVHAHTHSAGLSCEMISEMTSLENVKRRADMGAGLPARKDFYDLYGEGSVKHASYMTWSRLLLFCGARARHRDRAIPDTIRVRDFNLIVYREMSACLEFAALQPANIAGMIQMAQESVLRISRGLAAKHHRAGGSSSEGDN